MFTHRSQPLGHAEHSGRNNGGSLSSQVFSMFLETLVDFIVLHREDLQDWLFVLLTQLLKKMGADLLGSVQAKVQKALDVTRLCGDTGDGRG